MHSSRTAALVATVAALAACDKVRPIPGAIEAPVQVAAGDPTGGSGGGTVTVTVRDCTRCHGTQGLVLADADPLAAAAPPRAATGETASPVVGAHRAHVVKGALRNAMECASCHLVPTRFMHPPQQQGKVSFSRLATTAWSGAPLAPTWNGTTCASTYCHGNFPGGNAANAPAWTGVAAQAQCGTCHGIPPGAPHPQDPPGGPPLDCGVCHPGYTRGSVNLALHVNGQVEGGESSGAIACDRCHGPIFDAMNGTVPHATRHALGAVAGTNDAPTDSGIPWANPLSSNAAAARSCVNMCHGDHPHDLVSPLTATHENNAYLDATSAATRAGGTASRIGVGGTGGTPNRARTDFDATQANGGLCVSCHQYPVEAGLNPAHPAVARAAFDASAHDYGANTVGTVTYSWGYQLHDGGVFVRDCTKCHASSAEGTTPTVPAGGSATVAVHFGDNASLLAGTIRPAGTAAGFVCYNCHGTGAPGAGAQGNRSGKDIQGQIAHATTAGQSGHPASSDTVHDSVAEWANAAFGNALGVAAGAGQRHASCLDCHDPHQARAGTHAVATNVAGPPLQGAWGAQLSTPPGFWADPAAASFTKKTIVAGTDLEATLCFKCHSSYYGTLPASPSGGFAETDTAKEFNPGNAGNWYTTGTTTTWSSGETAGGFHPVLASAGNDLGAINMANLVTTNFAWRTSGARNLMTCTDCHESDNTTDPNGPHGSAAGFILRGPNTGWSSTTTTTATGMPNGTFCANCHRQDMSNSRYSDGTNLHYSQSNHQVACWNCHARIPHGGPRPGMLVGIGGACTAAGTAGGNSRCQANVGGQIAGWDVTSVYAGLPPGGSSLYIMGYPTSPTTNWSQSNCGCSTNGGH